MAEAPTGKVVLNDALLQSAMDALPQHLAIVDGKGNILWVNEAWQRFDQEHFSLFPEYKSTNVFDAWLIGHPMTPVDSCRSRAGLAAVLSGHIRHFGLEYVDYMFTQTRWFKLTFTQLRHTWPCIVISRLEISEQKLREANIQQQANQDLLTGLANRRLFCLEADKVLALAQRQATPFALLYLDLDHFKSINDKWGHAAGDALLCEVGARLQAHARESDILARFGGDEFVVLLNNVTAQESLISMQRLQESLSQPFTVRGQILNVSVSFGVARYPGDGTTLEALLNKADQVMYCAKIKGEELQFNHIRKLHTEVQLSLTLQGKNIEKLGRSTS
jgi:diguanylate cyclase (GGDEF)-like protein